MFGYSLVGLEVDTDSEDVKEVEENETTARSAFYQILARQFHAPDAEAAEAIRNGEPQKKLGEAAADLPYDLPIAKEAPPTGGLSADEIAAEFIRLFDVGADGPPCPLFGGAYKSDRMGVMEETKRFYDYFGLKLSSDYFLPPDHLATELDFMQYLTFKEAASASPRLARSYASAQRDFLERQVLSWLPEAVSRLEKAEPHPYFRWLLDLTAALAEVDRAYASERLAGQ